MSILLVCVLAQSVVTLPAQGIVRALFYRPLDACVNGSIRIEPGQPHAVIWAFGMGDFDLGHENENRGNSCEWKRTQLLHHTMQQAQHAHAGIFSLHTRNACMRGSLYDGYQVIPLLCVCGLWNAVVNFMPSNPTTPTTSPLIQPASETTTFQTNATTYNSAPAVGFSNKTINTTTEQIVSFMTPPHEIPTSMDYYM